MFSKIRNIKLKKHEVISKAWFVGCFITGVSLVTFASSPTTVTNRPSTRAAREAKMISTIQKVTTTSSSTTLSSMPDANGVVKTKICPRTTLQYKARSGQIHTLANPQKFVGENFAHNICFIENGFTLDGFVAPVRDPVTTSSTEQISTYVQRYHTYVKNFAYTMFVGGNVVYSCQEDSISKTPKWVLLRGCEIGVTESDTVTHTYYDVDSTPAGTETGGDPTWSDSGPQGDGGAGGAGS